MVIRKRLRRSNPPITDHSSSLTAALSVPLTLELLNVSLSFCDGVTPDARGVPALETAAVDPSTESSKSAKSGYFSVSFLSAATQAA